MSDPIDPSLLDHRSFAFPPLGDGLQAALAEGDDPAEHDRDDEDLAE